MLGAFKNRTWPEWFAFLNGISSLVPAALGITYWDKCPEIHTLPLILVLFGLFASTGKFIEFFFRKPAAGPEKVAGCRWSADLGCRLASLQTSTPT